VKAEIMQCVRGCLTEWQPELGSLILVECVRGWLFWLNVILDFFCHQFLEPDLLTRKELLDLYI